MPYVYISNSFFMTILFHSCGLCTFVNLQLRALSSPPFYGFSSPPFYAFSYVSCLYLTTIPQDRESLILPAHLAVVMPFSFWQNANQQEFCQAELWSSAFINSVVFICMPKHRTSAITSDHTPKMYAVVLRTAGRPDTELTRCVKIKGRILQAVDFYYFYLSLCIVET